MGARLRAALVLLIVFALGVVTGLAIAIHYPGSVRPAMSAEEEHRAAMEELRTEIGLDEEQIEQVHAILAKHRGAVQRSWEQLRPEVQDAMRQVHVEIAEILNPDQQKRFHEWLLRRHRLGRQPDSRDRDR